MKQQQPQQPQMSPTETAHQDLRNILLNGRIMINGMPPTATEMSVIIQGEMLLFSKAMKLDQAQALAEGKKAKLPEPPKGPKIVPIKEKK